MHLYVCVVFACATQLCAHTHAHAHTHTHKHTHLKDRQTGRERQGMAQGNHKQTFVHPPFLRPADSLTLNIFFLCFPSDSGGVETERGDRQGGEERRGAEKK